MHSNSPKVRRVSGINREETVGSSYVQKTARLRHLQQVAQESLSPIFPIGSKLHAVSNHANMLQYLMRHYKIEMCVGKRKSVIHASCKTIWIFAIRPKEAAAAAVCSPSVVPHVD